MTEIRNTTARSIQANTKCISMYLARDAAVNIRGQATRREAADGAEGSSQEQRTELGDSLLQIGLADQTGTAPADWQIGRAANGGPVIRRGPDTLPDLRISLSHSGDYIVAGICDAATIGVDIERHGTRRFAAIAEHLDWPVSTWDRPGSLQADAFYHLWTLWEAAIKSCSTDSAGPAESIFERIVPEVTIGVPGPASAPDWFASSWQCADSFWLSTIANYSQAPDIHLFLVHRLKSAQHAARITEIASADGRLDPELFQ